MRSLDFLVCLAVRVAAQTGAAEGFAKGVTGGGTVTAVTPTTNAELVSYLGSLQISFSGLTGTTNVCNPLGDSSARVIRLTKTFDFTGSEGSVTETGCAPWGTAAGCQLAINANSWCGTNPAASVTYDKAGTTGIDVASQKTIVGIGSSGVIKGKGLRLVNGVSNVIIQNIHITDLNPEYVWGGDALNIDGDLVWIDHVKVSLVGRQMVRTGNEGAKRITISNSEFDGITSWSASCNGDHYWGFLMQGDDDKVTMKGNYIHDTSGRGPKVSGTNALFHAVNNFWYSNTGHAFDISAGPAVVIEGNQFESVNTPIQGTVSTTFTAPDTNTNTACTATLGHACQPNNLVSSGTLAGASSTSFLSRYQGQSVAVATQNTLVKRNVLANAGIGKI